MNQKLLSRQVTDTIKGEKPKYGKYVRPNKGQQKPRALESERDDGNWKQADTAEKTKLKEKALEMHKKVQMEKNEAQKIRLILNVITPDNYDKKFKELRTYVFGDFKTHEECKAQKIQFDPMESEDIQRDLLETVV